MSEDSFDPYYQWLGIPPKQQPPSHYRLLALEEFESNPDVIENAADQRAAHVRLFQGGQQGDLSQRLLNEISMAKLCLLNAEKKAHYDAKLQAEKSASCAAQASISAANGVEPFDESRDILESPSSGLPPPQLIPLGPNPLPSSEDRTPLQAGGRAGLFAAIGGAAGGVVMIVVLALLLQRNWPTTASQEGGPVTATVESDKGTRRGKKKEAVEPKAVQEPEVVQPKPEVVATNPPESKLAGDSQPNNLFAGTIGGQEWSDNSRRMKFCWCPLGKFTMGSPKEEAGRVDNEDQVPVTISRGFWLGKYEVTQAEWTAVMHTRPWSGKKDVTNGGAYPATHVGFEDAAQFCNQLTRGERASGRLPADWQYTLPTEAQWEYACRAGEETPYSFGDDEARLPDYAWFNKNAWETGEKYAHQVGTKRGNAWGLHDMHGNVWEWCRDRYDQTLPGGVDPEVTTEKVSDRVRRGGSWYDGGWGCRSASRGKSDS